MPFRPSEPSIRRYVADFQKDLGKQHAAACLLLWKTEGGAGVENGAVGIIHAPGKQPLSWRPCHCGLLWIFIDCSWCVRPVVGRQVRENH